MTNSAIYIIWNLIGNKKVLSQRRPFGKERGSSSSPSSTKLIKESTGVRIKRDKEKDLQIEDTIVVFFVTTVFQIFLLQSLSFYHLFTSFEGGFKQ